MMGYYGNDFMFGGFGIAMIVLYILVIALVVVLVVLAIRRVSSHDQRPPSQYQGDQSMEAARMRYAKGEISKEEYEEICKTLIP